MEGNKQGHCSCKEAEITMFIIQRNNNRTA